ncbi:hypothetical protein ACQKWADRAFT_53490 [Trichoderma austrokoningii]
MSHLFWWQRNGFDGINFCKSNTQPIPCLRGELKTRSTTAAHCSSTRASGKRTAAVVEWSHYLLCKNQGLETHLIGICFLLGLVLDYSALFRLTVSPVGYAILAGASRAIVELPLVTLDCQPGNLV